MRLTLTLALAATAAVGALPASATTPGQNGLIAFTRYRLQDAPLRSEIFVVAPDGRGLKRVSHSQSAVEDDQAKWSPDGSWLVFDRCTSNGPCSIWLVRPDGSGQRRISPACPSHRLPPTCVDDSNPSFAPDGKHVVFQHEWGRIEHERTGDQIEHSAVAMIDLGGTHMTVLRELDGFQGDLEGPRISPDGAHLLFGQLNSSRVRPAGGRALFVATIHGSRQRRITPWRLSAVGGDWSPDASTILFRSTRSGGELTPGTNLYTVHSDGGALRRLTRVTPDHYVLSGTYSPDGTAVVFATDEDSTPNPRGGTFADIVTMNLKDRLTAHVTRSPNLDGWPSWGSSH